MTKTYTPSDKSPAMEVMFEHLFGRSSAIEGSLCVSCDAEVGDFNDALSEREYSISGLCQACQDAVFGDNDD